MKRKGWVPMRLLVLLMCRILGLALAQFTPFPCNLNFSDKAVPQQCRTPFTCYNLPNNSFVEIKCACTDCKFRMALVRHSAAQPSPSLASCPINSLTPCMNGDCLTEATDFYRWKGVVGAASVVEMGVSTSEVSSSTELTCTLVSECVDQWMGSSCNQPMCEPRCQNGDCELPNTCKCNSGWQGERCQTPSCPNCDQGKCVAPENCQCKVGWSGRDCSVLSAPFEAYPWLYVVLIFVVLAGCLSVCWCLCPPPPKDGAKDRNGRRVLRRRPQMYSRDIKTSSVVHRLLSAVTEEKDSDNLNSSYSIYSEVAAEDSQGGTRRLPSSGQSMSNILLPKDASPRY